VGFDAEAEPEEPHQVTRAERRHAEHGSYDDSKDAGRREDLITVSRPSAVVDVFQAKFEPGALAGVLGIAALWGNGLRSVYTLRSV